MKKILSLLAVFALVLSLLAGCGSGTEVEYYDTEAEQQADAVDTAESADASPAVGGVSIMLGGSGYETYAPDTVVGVIDGTEVTWMEYYYWLSYYANYFVQLANSRGLTLSSWDAVGELSSENTNAEALFASVEYTIKQYHAVAANTASAGIVLTDEDWDAIESVYDTSCDTDGDGEVTEEEIAAFEAYLADNCVDKDFYLYLNEIALLSDRTFTENFGEYGEMLPDSIAEDYITGNGILNAKHILLLTVDNATGESLDEDLIAEKLMTATTLQEELAAVQDDKDALIALFDEYMADYTEDSGYAANPDGYIFMPGQMTQEFEGAVLALDENYGLSDVVESPYGYHIIMRQPVTPDTVVGMNNNGQEVTIRYVAAEEQFSAMLDSWTVSAEVEWYDGFAAPDMLAIFG